MTDLVVCIPYLSGKHVKRFFFLQLKVKIKKGTYKQLYIHAVLLLTSKTSISGACKKKKKKKEYRSKSQYSGFPRKSSQTKYPRYTHIYIYISACKRMYTYIIITDARSFVNSPSNGGGNDGAGYGDQRGSPYERLSKLRRGQWQSRLPSCRSLVPRRRPSQGASRLFA